MQQQQIVQTAEDRITELKEQILSILYQTNEQTDQMMVKLDEQGNKIDKQGEQMVDTQNKLYRIEYITKNIKSGFGQFMGLFTKPKKIEVQQKNKPPNKEIISQLTKEDLQQLKQHMTSKQMNDLYDEINNQVLLLRNKQIQINKTLDQQNKQLDDQNKFADKQTQKMLQINTMAKQIIK